MAEAESLRKALVARYGEAHGESVYQSMKGEGSGPFGPGGKYRGIHEAFAKKNGVMPSKATKSKAKKKPRHSGKRRG